MPKYKKGDICILVSSPAHTNRGLLKLIGTEVVLLLFTAHPPNASFGGLDWWDVMPVGGGEIFCAREAVLIKKRPPREQVGSWDMIKIQTGNSTGYVPPSRVKTGVPA